MDKKKVKRSIGKSVAVLAVAFAILSIVSKRKKRDTVYDNEPEQKNSLEGKKVIFVEDENDKENADGIRGHLEAIGACDHKPGFYERYIKRGIDIVLSFGGLVVLSPVFALTALAIKIEDPGPVFFTQKRVGQNKKYFKLHKFRSMKMCTPHDVPTHMLDNPDQYITKVGKFIRAHSLDELPQIWDIFVGNMSVIGPRPGLWNQDLLTAERDKYGANDVKPGLTGWAQINGRDELEIPDKAKLDGEYVRKLGPIMDAKVFLGSLHVFGKDDSVVEGGTGEISKVGRHYTDGKSDEDLIGHIGFGEPVTVDTETKKKVLITGAGSYIGESFKKYAEEHYSALDIETLDMLDPDWKKKDFSEFDIVYHVAGLAHADVGNVDDATKAKYYAVNTDLAVEVCKKAKSEGVKEFIFMSSMIVYGDSAPYGKDKIIDEHTVPKAANFYGDSKLQADVAVRSFADDSFKVLVIRPPMIYGKGSKGNYPTLAKLAKKLPVFPDVDNKRSMLHIDNLCEFLCQIMLVSDIKENATVFMPQNAEWTKTSDMVKKIADVSGKKIRTLKIFRPAVFIGSKMPGKIGGLINKAFGNSCYEKELSNYEGIKYQTTSLSESVVGKVILIKSSIEYKELSDNEMQSYSVLMSVYKNDKVDYLCSAIDSMLKQTVKPEQFVIVIDGPISNSLENVIIDYSISMPQIFTILRLKENGGLGNALNQGLKLCRNELVARMDSDDISKKYRCEKQLCAFRTNPKLCIVGTQIDEFIDNVDNVVSRRIVPTNQNEIQKFAKRRSPFNHPTVMYRKSIIESLGGYGIYGRKEDLDLFIRCVNSGVKMENLEESLLYYRTSNDNLQRRMTWTNCKEYIQIMNRFRKKKFINCSDFMYVLFGQLAMFLLPPKIVKWLNESRLRTKV